jgi:hypothetical protein
MGYCYESDKLSSAILFVLISFIDERLGFNIRSQIDNMRKRLILLIIIY